VPGAKNSLFDKQARKSEWWELDFEHFFWLLLETPLFYSAPKRARKFDWQNVLQGGPQRNLTPFKKQLKTQNYPSSAGTYPKSRYNPARNGEKV
jgi:hypothetical protein